MSDGILVLVLLGQAYFGSVIGYALASERRDGWAVFLWPVVVYLRRRSKKRG